MHVRLEGLIGSDRTEQTFVPPVNRLFGPLLVSYRRRLPEHTIASLWSACLIEGVAIGVLAIPDLALRVFFSSALLGIAVVLVYLVLFRSAVRIDVHEYGVILTKNGRTESALFESLVRVYTSATIAWWRTGGTALPSRGPMAGLGPDQKISLNLELGDGRVVSIEGWDRELRPACEAILERATGVIAPRVLADFYAGQDVDFGGVRLSKNLISARQERMSLKRVASASVRRGRFTVVDDGGRTFVSMECFEVANLEALLMLLSRVQGRST